MQSSNVKQTSKLCKCSYCLNTILRFPNTLEHQNSTNIHDSSTFHYDFATATTSSLYPHTQFTNPESLPTLPESFRRFTRSFPQYLTTVEADQIRATEYRHLCLSSLVCLDYNGHSLFSFSQKQQQEHKLQDGKFVASSSSTVPCLNQTGFKERESNSSSLVSSLEFESKLKGRIMRYLNVSEDDYSIILTPNQTSAFGVLAESYPFHSSRNLITVYDYENEAIEAMIKTSRSRGARVSSAEFKWPKLKIHCNKLEDLVVRSTNKKKNKRLNKGLFVFPIQSRVSGARYSYQWMSSARENGWHVLLDASALSPKEMDTLGLSLFRPDFLIGTFYKVFGEDPSGFACLLVRKSVSSILDHSKISSYQGIVSLINPVYQGIELDNGIIEHQSGNMLSLKNDHTNTKVCDMECKGLDHADALGLVLISNRVRCLINWLTNALSALYHPNCERGIQLVQVYGPRVKFDRGSSLAFNVFDWKGERVDPTLVQKLADRNNISLGCAVLQHVWFSERYKVEKEKVLMEGPKGGRRNSKGKIKGSSENGIHVVTANVGFLSNFEDVYALWKFVSNFLDADFVEKERWRYTALNQKCIELWLNLQTKSRKNSSTFK